MIRCWYYKTVGFWFHEDARPLPAQAQRHFEQCSACRQHFAIHNSLEDRLSTESPLAFPQEPPFLYEKIMAGIHAEKHGRKMPGRTTPGWLMPASALALLALLVTLTLTKTEQPNLLATSPGALAANHLVAVETNLEQSIPLSTNSVAQWSALLDDPLQTEMASVIKDARNAALVLASNFLPPHYLE